MGLLRRRVFWLGLLALLALSASSCSQRMERSEFVEIDGERVPVQRLQDAVRGLCTARSQAVASDPESARITFQDQSHDGLHKIASAVDKVDRPAAGSLLAAKVKVEEDLAQGAPPRQLEADLDRLLEQTRLALKEISVASPDCPPA